MFLAQQAAALEHYNRARNNPEIHAQMAAQHQARQSQEHAAHAAGRTQQQQRGGGGVRQPGVMPRQEGGLMQMLGSLMENMSERVIPTEMGGGGRGGGGGGRR